MKDYFYSRMPNVERAFSQIEGGAKKIISKIILENDLSKISDQDYIILLFFISLQYARTPRMKQETEQFFNLQSDHFFKSFVDGNIENLKEKGLEKEFLDKCRMVVDGPVHAFAMKSIMERGPFLIKDLRDILFINCTTRNFITSDSPIVLYNSFFNNPEGHFLFPFSGTNGLQSPGLQIFYPLDTKHMLVLYDKTFYNFKVNLKGNADIYLEDDIDALNALQIFNCSDSILFADHLQEENIRGMHSKYEGTINNQYYSIDTINKTKSNGQKSEIIISYTKDIDYRLVLSFMYFNMNLAAIDIARDFNIANFVDRYFQEKEEQFDRLFYLGKFIVTEEADRILFLEKPTEDLLDLLKRHVSGDWGEVCQEEKDRNDKAVEDGSRILSAYTLSTGKKILVLTEAANELGHRKVTKILTSIEFDLLPL